MSIALIASEGTSQIEEQKGQFLGVDGDSHDLEEHQVESLIN